MFSQPRCRQYFEMDVLKLVLVSLASWMNRQQQEVIDYLQEEVRVLKEMSFGVKRRYYIRFIGSTHMIP